MNPQALNHARHQESDRIQDELDRILAYLIERGESPFNEMHADLQLDPKLVYNRLQRLRAQNLVIYCGKRVFQGNWKSFYKPAGEEDIDQQSTSMADFPKTWLAWGGWITPEQSAGHA